MLQEKKQLDVTLDLIQYFNQSTLNIDQYSELLIAWIRDRQETLLKSAINQS